VSGTGFIFSSRLVQGDSPDLISIGQVKAKITQFQIHPDTFLPIFKSSGPIDIRSAEDIAANIRLRSFLTGCIFFIQAGKIAASPSPWQISKRPLIGFFHAVTGHSAVVSPILARLDIGRSARPGSCIRASISSGFSRAMADYLPRLS